MAKTNSREDNIMDFGQYKKDETENIDLNATAETGKIKKKGEVLSKEEVNQLLKSINEGGMEPEDFKPPVYSRKIKIYDFKRPDRFSKEQIRMLSLIHDTFARLTTTYLSAQLRSMVHVSVASVDQLTFEEFIRTIPTPTTLSIINMDPLEGNAILEIDPAISFSIIDRICGGIGDGTRFQHELTDFEISLMEGIIIRLLGNLREAWYGVLDMRPRLAQIDTNPQYAQIVPPAEMVALVTLETKIGDVEGLINFCIPYLTIEPILCKLANWPWYGKYQSNTPLTSSSVFENIPVRLTAEILKRDFPINEILRWDIGTVILPLRPLSPDCCYLKLRNWRVWQCQILPECKWFPKRITIVKYAEKPFGTEGNMEMDKVNPLVRDALSTALVKITVELGATMKIIKEVFAMGEGTIVELDKLAGEPLDVLANGVLIAKGEAVVIDENFGVRLTEIIGKPDTPRQFGQSEPQQPAPEPTKTPVITDEEVEELA